MGMAGQRQRNTLGFRLVKVIWIVRQKEVRRAMLRRQVGPIRFAENQVINAAKNELPLTVPQSHRLVSQCFDSDGAKVPLNPLGVSVEVVVISVAEPRAKRRVRQGREAIKVRTNLARLARYDISTDRYQVWAEFHERKENPGQRLRPEEYPGVDIRDEQYSNRIEVLRPVHR